ncbi:amidohydrolase family protein [bacterium BFN5]|nr:amidohydrolase family protein [bacterium BFN5]
MKQLIRQATIVFPDHVAANYEMLIVDGVISAISANSADEYDCNSADFFGDMIIPGLIDTHVHGAGGCDIMDGTTDSLVTLRQALLREGTTAFLGTTLSSPVEQLLVVLKSLTAGWQAASQSGQAELLGVHLEGPFLTAEYKGAHVGQFIPPSTEGGDVSVLTQLVKTYPDLIRILTFAVDRLDTTELIDFCHSQNGLPGYSYSCRKKEITGL